MIHLTHPTTHNNTSIQNNKYNYNNINTINSTDMLRNTKKSTIINKLKSTETQKQLCTIKSMRQIQTYTLHTQTLAYT